jgi:hypothetical protein
MWQRLLLIITNVTEMADNYLEKRMEDYRRGAQVRHVSSHGLKYPAVGVFVSQADSPMARAIIKIFVEAGSRVAFTLADPAAGRLMAQQCGGRFYPMTDYEALADVAARGEKIDLVVACGGDVNLPEGARLISIGREISGAVSIIGDNADAAAWLAVAVARVQLPPQTILV